MEENYSTRQQERMLDKQSDDLKEHIRLIIDPLTQQVKKTNGRVTRMEKAILVISSALAALGISNPEVVKILSYLIH